MAETVRIAGVQSLAIPSQGAVRVMQQNNAMDAKGIMDAEGIEAGNAGALLW
jgi:hypothetical protein